MRQYMRLINKQAQTQYLGPVGLKIPAGIESIYIALVASISLWLYWYLCKSATVLYTSKLLAEAIFLDVSTVCLYPQTGV